MPAKTGGCGAFEIGFPKTTVLCSHDGRSEVIRPETCRKVKHHAQQVSDNLRRKDVLRGELSGGLRTSHVLPLQDFLLHALVWQPDSRPAAAGHHARAR